MYVTGQILKNIREAKGLQLQSVRDSAGIDPAQLSKIENGRRLPTAEQLRALANLYDCDENSLIVQCESDRLLKSVYDLDLAPEILKVAEAKLAYGERYVDEVQDRIMRTRVAIESRRYIGSKAKLADWIMDVVEEECQGADSFCDLFAGTAVVAAHALERFGKVHINDFLYVNNVVYRAFFEDSDWDGRKIEDIIASYNALEPPLLPDNYFSDSFGGKYFDYEAAKLIGHIRQDIEDLRPELTEKEYCILLASLVYAADRIANTVGHFDAYIKKTPIPRPFRLRMIDAARCPGTVITRSDANLLVRSLHADVVYIDPPYNSRQYCSAYHVLENLAKWERPELRGVARKPLAMENKSAYCTNSAADAFADLIRNMDAKYAVVSYNNMAQKGNGRSNAKIDDRDIMSALSSRGEVKVFSRCHKAFSAGKSNIEDNQERLFVCKFK